MTAIYLIRHAEAEGNVYRRAHGHFDGRVTARGDIQIEQLKKRFEDVKIDAVYSSDLFRTQKTAAAISVPHGLTINTDERLREVNVGIWEDTAWGDIHYQTPQQSELFSSDPEKWHVEGCESFINVQKRMTECITEIAKRHDGGCAAVFSHGFSIRAFLSGLLGIPSEKISEIPYCDNTAVALLRFEADRFSIEYHGDNSHLHAEESTFANQSWWRKSSARYHENLRFMPFNGTRDRQILELCRSEVSTEFFANAVYTAFLGDEPVGFLGVDTERDEDNAGWIYHIYIAPDFRQKDLGIQLLGQAISVYRKLGRDKIRVRAESGKKPAAEFYAKNGFTELENTREESGTVYTMEKGI